MDNIFIVEGCEIAGWNGLYRVKGKRNGKDLYCHAKDEDKEISFEEGGSGRPFGWMLGPPIQFYIMQRQGSGSEPTKVPPTSGWVRNSNDEPSALRIEFQFKLAH